MENIYQLCAIIIAISSLTFLVGNAVHKWINKADAKPFIQTYCNTCTNTYTECNKCGFTDCPLLNYKTKVYVLPETETDENESNLPGA